MNKSLLIAIAAAVAVVGIWFGIQSRQAPEVIDPVVEPMPEPDVLEEPEVTEPEVTEPEVTEPVEEDVVEEEATTEELMEDVADEAAETVEEAVDGAVDATTEAMDSLVDGITGEDGADTGSEAAVEEAIQEAEGDLSPAAAVETADAIEESLELEALGLDPSIDAIRTQIDAADLNMADRTIIDGLLDAAGENPELLQQVVDRLREMTAN